MQDPRYMTDEQVSIKYNDFLLFLKEKYPDKKRGELIEMMRNDEIDYHAPEFREAAMRAGMFNDPWTKASTNPASTTSSTKPIITCPYCQSTDTKKITTTKKFFSTGVLGLASSTLGKNFHCNRCKADF